MSQLQPFSGVDGESYTVSGEHRYVLLMDSSGAHIFDPDGLSTKRCFDFLLSLPPKHIYAAFGLNYDVNMMLVDFGRQRLKELWRDGETMWFDYHVQWIPGKWFRLRKGDKSIKVNEVFGFYQCSFVKALEKWKIPTQDLDKLEGMKATRSIFTDEMRTEIIEYCHTETLLLNQLLEKLREALLSVGIKNTSWNGAGSIAAAILRKERVKDHLVHQHELPQEIQYATLKAYFGGRTELFQQGEFSTLYQYDIVSAYPYAAISLPTLQQGTWTHVHRYSRVSPYSIWHVRYGVVGKLSPFPYRYKGSRIMYPTNGEGWYHQHEVSKAVELFGSQIEVIEGWVFTPANDSKPFDFIPALAAEKVRYKREGHAGEKVLKLGINSLYGKLAQGVGFNDQPPPFQSYFWAGYITSHCRSVMLDLAFVAGDSLVMIATDGIFTSEPLPVMCGIELGNLEGTILTNAFTAQPGVYCATKDGVEIRKSRGFFAKEIDFDALRMGYREMGDSYIGHYTSTRFIGLGTGLMAKTLDKWRTWETKERKLVLHPSSKRVADPDARPVVHFPPVLPDHFPPSAPYKPKRGGYTEDEEDYTQGKEQPLRVD